MNYSADPKNAKTPEEYISLLEEPRKSQIKMIHELIRKTVPKLKPFFEHGKNGIGYGSYHYKYASGRQGDAALIGLASQKSYMALYICAVNGKGYLAEQYKKDLGNVNTGRSCVRFNKVKNLNLKTIKIMLKEAEKLGGMGAVGAA